MRVFLSEDLFEEGCSDLLGIIGLIELARSGRHRMLLRPSFVLDDERDLPRNRWLRERDARVRDQLCGLLAVSARDASVDGPQTLEITVTAVAQSCWDEPLALTLADAKQFLGMPLLLLLEDHDNDWRFLRALCPPQLRSELDRAHAEAWLRVGGGGTGNLKKRLAAWAVGREAGNPGSQQRRAWLMFDRDAARDDPLRPSEVSEELRRTCEELGVPHRQLARRTIENYLPLEVLRPEGSSRRDSFRARVDALSVLREQHPREAFALSIKEGLLKDSGLEKRQRKPFRDRWKAAESSEQRREIFAEVFDRMPAAWQMLPEQLRADLLDGFGDRAEAFARCDSEPDWEDRFQAEYDRGPDHQPSRETFASSLLGLI